MRRSARSFDQRVDVLDLALLGVRGGVPALVTTAAVIHEDGEVRREQRGELRHGAESAAAQSTVDEDERRTLANALVRYRGAIFGGDRVHGVSFEGGQKPDSIGRRTKNG